MGKKGGYHPYRGHSPLRTFLKLVAAALALVLAFFLAVILFLDPYWTYSSEGARLHLPWNGREEPAPAEFSPSPSPSEVVVVVSPPPEEKAPALHALALPRTALSDGSAVSLLSQVGANAAILDMKADDGSLGYLSALEAAASAGVNPSDPAINDEITAFNRQEDLYTVARVSCFRDNTMPRENNKLAIRSPAGNWRDTGGMRWLSPYVEEAREYITGVCLELAALGFDEILLDNASYPTDGNLNYIQKNDAYPADRLDTVVTQFYTQLSETLKESYPDIVLSVVTDDDAILAGSNAGGQTRDGAAQLDRIWVQSPAEQESVYAQQLEDAGLTNSGIFAVLIGDTPGQNDQSWAVWW